MEAGSTFDGSQPRCEIEIKFGFAVIRVGFNDTLLGSSLDLKRAGTEAIGRH
jgi:hypothetical protein